MTYDVRIINNLGVKVDERIAAITKYLAEGRAQSYDDYRHHAGIVQGLTEAMIMASQLLQDDRTPDQVVQGKQRRDNYGNLFG